MPTDQTRSSRVETVLETIAVIATFLPFTLLARHWNSLPEKVPVHFDLSGKVDSWGPRGSLFLLPLASLLVYLILSVLTYSPRFQEYIHLPSRVDKRSPKALRLIKEMLILSKSLVVILLFQITASQIQVALGNAQGLPLRNTLILTAALLLVPPIYVMRMRDPG